MFNIGLPEMLVIFFVILLLFGAKRLPDLARSMGKAIREFKKASNDIVQDTQETPVNKEKPSHETTPAG